MMAGRANGLFINGVRDDGTIDVIQANPFGKLQITTEGSCNVATYLPGDSINVSRFIIDHHLQQEIDVKHILKHDFVFCEISDPDSHATALRKAQSLFDALHNKIPWINNPHMVPNTRRDEIPTLLSDIDGIVAPPTLRLKPNSVGDIQAAIESAPFDLPALLRPSGSHAGKNLVLIKEMDDLRKLEITKYPEAFLTQFIDFGRDGIYSKYRFAVVVGEPLLRHVLSNDHWMIHSEARAFSSSVPELVKFEEDILANFEQGLKLSVLDRIGEIYRRIGLDYFGIDCGFSGQDGEMILFEVNANMNILNNNQPLPNIWEGAIDKIRRSIMDRLILKRIR